MTTTSEWAWQELNLRPHAYQAWCSESGSPNVIADSPASERAPHAFRVPQRSYGRTPNVPPKAARSLSPRLLLVLWRQA
jgi:hypothetical protein